MFDLFRKKKETEKTYKTQLPPLGWPSVERETKRRKTSQHQVECNEVKLCSLNTINRYKECLMKLRPNTP